MSSERKYTTTTRALALRLENEEIKAVKAQIIAEIPKGEKYEGQPQSVFAKFSVDDLRRNNAKVEVFHSSEDHVFILGKQ